MDMDSKSGCKTLDIAILDSKDGIKVFKKGDILDKQRVTPIRVDRIFYDTFQEIVFIRELNKWRGYSECILNELFWFSEY